MGPRQQRWMPFRPPFLMAGKQFIEITSSHRIKLITRLLCQIRLSPATTPLTNPFGLPPMHLSGEIHQIYPVGDANGTPGDDVCEGSCGSRQWNSRTIPTVGIPRGGIFLFPSKPR